MCLEKTGVEIKKSSGLSATRAYDWLEKRTAAVPLDDGKDTTSPTVTCPNKASASPASYLLTVAMSFMIIKFA